MLHAAIKFDVRVAYGCNFNIVRVKALYVLVTLIFHFLKLKLPVSYTVAINVF